MFSRVLRPLLLLTPLFILSQESPTDSASFKAGAPNLFIDCGSCDMNYIRTEVDFVNYVIDRNDADIFIMITRQNTGSGGKEYTLTLEGRNVFEGVNDTLVYITDQEYSDDEIREKTLKYLSLGLVRYLSHTPLADELTIRYDSDENIAPPQDDWDYWVFKSSLDGWFDGQSSYSSMNLHGQLSARRVTEDWKLDFSLRLNYNQDAYIIDDEEYVNINRNPSMSSLIVKSLSQHFSAGLRAGVHSSTYGNKDISYWLNPAVEYNIYPYSESTRREFRIYYMVGYNFHDYHETTIYDMNEEHTLRHALDIDFEFRENWGSVEFSVQGSQYFHDLSQNRLDFHGNLSLKILKGFSYNIRGGYSLIHDQISLPKGAASQEEILLHQQELATQYNYWGSMGISYTFGSIYNNIVNPRF